MLINTITASVLLKAGHNSFKPPVTLPVYILQNAAGSGVGRLLTQVALDRGVRPIRLVRSKQSAEKLRSALPGPPVYSTSESDWKKQVREALGGHKLEVAFDAVGGKAIDDLAELVDYGGIIINFGSLESNTGTNIYSLAPNSLALRAFRSSVGFVWRKMRSRKISSYPSWKDMSALRLGTTLSAIDVLTSRTNSTGCAAHVGYRRVSGDGVARYYDMRICWTRCS